MCVNQVPRHALPYIRTKERIVGVTDSHDAEQKKSFEKHMASKLFNHDTAKISRTPLFIVFLQMISFSSRINHRNRRQRQTTIESKYHFRTVQSFDHEIRLDDNDSCPSLSG